MNEFSNNLSSSVSSPHAVSNCSTPVLTMLGLTRAIVVLEFMQQNAKLPSAQTASHEV